MPSRRRLRLLICAGEDAGIFTKPYAKRVNISSATKGDRNRWLELRKGLWPHYGPENLEREIDELLADADKNITFLASENKNQDIPIAFIEISIRDQAPGSDGQPIPYVEGWYVVPHARKKGIGKALIEVAAEWARKRGFNKLASDTTSKYLGSKEAHRAVGFELVRMECKFIKNIS